MAVFPECMTANLFSPHILSVGEPNNVFSKSVIKFPHSSFFVSMSSLVSPVHILSWLITYIWGKIIFLHVHFKVKFSLEKTLKKLIACLCTPFKKNINPLALTVYAGFRIFACTLFKCCFLEHQLALKGSSYSGLLERHNIHTHNVGHIVDNLQ